jgi:hypothetical protein
MKVGNNVKIIILLLLIVLLVEYSVSKPTKSKCESLQRCERVSKICTDIIKRCSTIKNRLRHCFKNCFAKRCKNSCLNKDCGKCQRLCRRRCKLRRKRLGKKCYKSRKLCKLQKQKCRKIRNKWKHTCLKKSTTQSTCLIDRHLTTFDQTKFENIENGDWVLVNKPHFEVQVRRPKGASHNTAFAVRVNARDVIQVFAAKIVVNGEEIALHRGQQFEFSSGGGYAKKLKNKMIIVSASDEKVIARWTLVDNHAVVELKIVVPKPVYSGLCNKEFIRDGKLFITEPEECKDGECTSEITTLFLMEHSNANHVM